MERSDCLANKRALVTGASSGIGRAIALSLARAGVQVALLARRKDRLESLRDEISALGQKSILCTVDLTDSKSTAEAISAAAAEFSGLDLLINAAGVALQAPLTDGNPEDWRTMLEVNVFALALVTQECLPHFPDEGGHIVNISSMSGHRVPGKGGFYSATKFAVRAMTEGIRQELREAGNLTRVSSISPGFVDTELLDQYFSEPGSAYEKIGFPLLQPEEIADLVLHQLSMPRTAEVTDILVRPTAQRT